MRRIAVVSPNTLVARDLRERLADRQDLVDEVRLLSADESEIGQLGSDAGAVTFVGRLDDEALESCDLAVFCGDAEADRRSFASLPAGCRAIVLSTGALASDGYPRVAGIGPRAAHEAPVWLSPHPAAYGAILLLARLESLGLVAAQAVIQLPVSLLGETALDGLFDQMRSLMTFKKPKATAELPRQLAFNVEPAGDDPGEIAAQIRAALDRPLPFSCQILRAGIFHGVGLSLRVQFESPVNSADVRRRLAADPRIELARRPETVSPIAVAGSEKVRVAMPAISDDDGVWLWAAYDNLSRGATLNALELADELLGANRLPA